MNRTDSTASERRMESPAPLTVDLPSDESGLRGGNVDPEAAKADLNHASHVLLAACGKNQSARECPHVKHGWMTAALLKLLKQVPIQNLTYDSLLSSLKIEW